MMSKACSSLSNRRSGVKTCRAAPMTAEESWLASSAWAPYEASMIICVRSVPTGSEESSEAMLRRLGCGGEAG
jgi:hypothetical protein